MHGIDHDGMAYTVSVIILPRGLIIGAALG